MTKETWRYIELVDLAVLVDRLEAFVQLETVPAHSAGYLEAFESDTAPALADLPALVDTEAALAHLGVFLEAFGFALVGQPVVDKPDLVAVQPCLAGLLESAPVH